MVSRIKNRSTQALQFPKFLLQPNESRSINWEVIDSYDIGAALSFYHEQKLYFCNDNDNPVISKRTATFYKEENGVLVEKSIGVDEVLEFLNKKVAEITALKQEKV